MTIEWLAGIGGLCCAALLARYGFKVIHGHTIMGPVEFHVRGKRYLIFGRSCFLSAASPQSCKRSQVPIGYLALWCSCQYPAAVVCIIHSIARGSSIFNFCRGLQLSWEFFV